MEHTEIRGTELNDKKFNLLDICIYFNRNFTDISVIHSKTFTRS